MATQPDFDILPDHASLDTSRSRTSIVASLRRRTSRLLGRHGPVTPACDTPDNTPQPVHATPPSKSKRNWINSVGARFRRTDHTALGSSDSSQDDAHIELRGTAGTTTPPKPASPPGVLPSPQSLGRHRRLFSSGRTRLHSLPARIRRRGSSIFRRASSSSLSDEGKENFVELDRTPARPASSANTGSWSSFRSGVQRAVREMVDGSFRFTEEHNTRTATPRPPPRAPLRTLWTIVSADSSEGNPPLSPTTTHTPKPYRLASPTWTPDWSPTSPHYILVSPSTDGPADSTHTHNAHTHANANAHVRGRSLSEPASTSGVWSPVSDGEDDDEGGAPSSRGSAARLLGSPVACEAPVATKGSGEGVVDERGEDEVVKGNGSVFVGDVEDCEAQRGVLRVEGLLKGLGRERGGV